jgi:hypothetical protein
MKYPQTIESKLNEVKDIIAKWPIEVAFDKVLKWIMQFDPDDFDLAVRIIKNLNVVGFEDLNNALTIAYSKLERMASDKGTKINAKNTLFAGIGEGGKSGAMIGYNFRLINELSEENFLDEKSIDYLKQGKIENIVLVDDIISTGNQATEEVKKLMENVIPLGVKNIFLLTAVGMKEGINKVFEQTNAYIFSAFEYDRNDTVVSLDSSFYDGIPFEERETLKKRIEYYGSKVSKSPFGYGGVGGLIVFYYNTPNSTLPLIWSDLNSWLPLVKRVRKINGIASYYKQFENVEPAKATAAKTKTELSLFVEGKTDEIFFEFLSPAISKETGYKKINVISLGGMFSDTFINNIDKLATKYIFLPDDDRFGNKLFRERVKKTLGDKPHVFVKSIFNYINVAELLDNEQFETIFPKKLIAEEFNSPSVIRELEHRILRRFPPSMRMKIVNDILNKHANKKEIDKLIQQIKVAIEKK